MFASRETEHGQGAVASAEQAGMFASRETERGQGAVASAEQAGMFASRETELTQYLEPAIRQQDTAVYYLVWESDPHAAPIPLQGPSLVIGRSREASGHLDATPGISRAHLELLRTEEGWTATDLGSRNGSKLNGTEMAAYEPYVLQPDDSLDLAGSVYRFKYGKLQRQAS